MDPAMGFFKMMKIRFWKAYNYDIVNNNALQLQTLTRLALTGALL